MAMMRSLARYIFLWLFVIVLFILHIKPIEAYESGREYLVIKHHISSQGDEPVVNLLINRIQEINARLSNPALSKGERQLLQRELELITEMLTKTLSRTTGIQN